MSIYRENLSWDGMMVEKTTILQCLKITKKSHLTWFLNFRAKNIQWIRRLDFHNFRGKIQIRKWELKRWDIFWWFLNFFDLLFGGEIGDEAARITCDAFSSRTKFAAHVSIVVLDWKKFPKISATSFCLVAKYRKCCCKQNSPLFEFVNKLFKLILACWVFFRSFSN